MESNDVQHFLINVGERLKYFRKLKGYSNYEQFAYQNNISRAQYGRYESGANISLKTLWRILVALDITPAEFFKNDITE